MELAKVKKVVSSLAVVGVLLAGSACESIPGPEEMNDTDEPLPFILQPGVKQVAAGYVVYGSSTVLTYTTGAGVHLFTLDPEIGAFVLNRENIRMPAASKMYSVNEAYKNTFPELASAVYNSTGSNYATVADLRGREFLML